MKSFKSFPSSGIPPRVTFLMKSGLFAKKIFNFRKMSIIEWHQELPLRFSRKGKNYLLILHY